MKISARNLLRGTVSRVEVGAVNSEVDVALASGDVLVAIITNRSVETLGIAAGSEVIALVKASTPLIQTDASGYRLSARNNLRGTVKSVTPGAVNAEVILSLAGGTDLCVIITNDAVRDLELAEGTAATAVIKASAIILGVPS